MNKSGAIIIEGHVQGLSNTRSLGEKGIPVIVIDTHNCLAHYSKYCNKFFICPEYNSNKFIEFLIKLCENENLFNWVLLPSNDHALLNISKHKLLLINYFKIIIDDLEIISKIYNKRQLLKLAEKVNVPIPRTYYPRDFYLKDFSLSFPVIIKGSEGLTFYKTIGKKVLLANSSLELKTKLNYLKNKIPIEQIFIQEVIKRRSNIFVCSCTAFSINGEIKTFWIGEKVREHPFEFGTATFTRSIPENDTLIYSIKLLQSLNYTGVSEIEYIFDEKDNKYKMIEINARTWLWVSLAKLCGIDYAYYVYNYLNGIKTEYPKVYKVNYYWINCFTDTIFTIKEVIRGKYSFFKYISSLGHVNSKAVFSMNDILPFFMFCVLSPYLFFRR